MTRRPATHGQLCIHCYEPVVYRDHGNGWRAYDGTDRLHVCPQSPPRPVKTPISSPPARPSAAHGAGSLSLFDAAAPDDGGRVSNDVSVGGGGDLFVRDHSHRADPSTSRQAAAAVAERLTDSMERTLAVVREHPGLHYEQIEALGGSQQRLSDLHKLGLIDSCGTGRTRRGQSATLWRVV